MGKLKSQSISFLKRVNSYSFMILLLVFGASQHSFGQHQKIKPRILVSTDIGGTDPDDNQSMIHLLMYANEFQIEGLVSSPLGSNGRKENILEMIGLYEKDLLELKKHAKGFPSPNSLRKIAKQGVIDRAPYSGYTSPTQGSDWIIKCAKKKSDQPLWVLVWGGMEDLAQALHDAPEIQKNIRVYYIGGPNKKWGVNAYTYIAQNFPNLWMIEANATYRGLFMDDGSSKSVSGKAYYGNYIDGRGAMGKDFIKYYGGQIKMGDTPSLAYLMHGNSDDPTGESWGGSFTSIKRSSRTIFDHNTTAKDTVAAYAVLEWRFKGPELAIAKDSVCFQFEVAKQLWPGYYLGNGNYAVRYSSKKPETGSYVTISTIPELNGQKGQYTSIVPWPGKPSPDDYLLGSNWYGDVKDSALFIGDQQGAKTIFKFREVFLLDWAKRWEWLKK
jgi:hypothetical protein